METLTSQMFILKFPRVFDHPLQQEGASKHLLNLKQGQNSISDHSKDFIVAEETGWDKLNLRCTFISSLSEQVKDTLATRDELGSLGELIYLAISIDNRLRE